MTRNEFHKKVKCNESYIGWHNAHELADELYDEFENRTCENCKYFKEGEDITHICTIGNSCGVDEYGVPTVLMSFGCNEFKEKR